MAGSSNIGEDGGENPVEINVVPMVDVIFCLCLFFMCSMHFKQLEGKVETWLPKSHGTSLAKFEDPVLQEIRVFLRWDGRATVRAVGSRAPAGSDDELTATLSQMAEDHRRLGRTLFPVVIDSQAAVPWQDVVHVLDLCKLVSLDRIEFAGPIEGAVR